MSIVKSSFAIPYHALSRVYTVADSMLLMLPMEITYWIWTL